MKKQILTLTAAFAMVGICSIPSLASQRHRERHERYEHDDHDRRERYEHRDRDGYRKYEHGEYREHDHHEKHGHRDHDRYEGYKHVNRDRRSYTTRKISDVEAKKIVANSMSEWKIGESWKKRKRNRTELIVPLRYQDLYIGKIKVHPSTGEIMPEDVKHSQKETKVTLAQASETVRQALPEMIIGDDIYLGKHGDCWKVPVMFKNIVIEDIKVDSSTGDIYSR